MSRPRFRIPDPVRDALQVAFRLVPWPTEPGLRSVGRPGPASPVIVTGNYDLTVRRVMGALSGLDAWVVVAPSGGINVWCAAAGGHLTTHQVVTALKTSGVQDEVAHRHAILPQLAATGIEVGQVADRCGWDVRFGPVYAEDLPRYLTGGLAKVDDMRRVRFGLAERLEMAAAAAAPAVLVVGGGAWWLRQEWALPLAGLVVATALAVFLFYDRLPSPRAVLLGGALVGLSLLLVWLAGGDRETLAVAAAASALLTAAFTFDYPGATPIDCGSFFEERCWRVRLDLESCTGVLACLEVCPEGCFAADAGEYPLQLVHEERCIRCGACVVQCPEDALFFEDQAGDRVAPDVIRRFKLNLLGRRKVVT